ncbi:DUF4181 domain-containing protein [Paenisporosarcina antarctica]|uniref:DUF4181 domain-containing protein n=1 Tax=Paenisporosarcina antarctica TaxID=417367 RepID=A0A4P7A1S0_9BACL|nr:DUF4181 domain-containing protein [Paenisporosarcina antarctica]QBP42767.1 DUF4181 domain-containing protein [Paenisporosarcina antarctica]
MFLVYFVLTTFIVTTVVKHFLRKILNIEKEKKEFFSYNHINKLHGKIDWVIRISSMLLIIIISSLSIYQQYPLTFFLIAMIIYIGIDQGVRAFFEWKYSQNPKQYILTISEMIVLMISILTIMQFNLFSS